MQTFEIILIVIGGALAGICAELHEIRKILQKQFGDDA